MCQIPPGMRAVMDTQRQMHPLIDDLQAGLQELGSGAADRWVIITAELLLIRVSLILFPPAFFTCVGGSSTNTSTSGNNAAAVMSGQMERV